MAGQKAEEAAIADLDPFLVQHRTQARNRQIRMRPQQLQDPCAMRLDHVAAPVAAHRQGSQTSALAIAAGNLAHSTRRHLETSRYPARRAPRLDRQNNPRAKIHREWCRHAHPPRINIRREESPKRPKKGIPHPQIRFHQIGRRSNGKRIVIESWSAPALPTRRARPESLTISIRSPLRHSMTRGERQWGFLTRQYTIGSEPELVPWLCCAIRRAPEAGGFDRRPESAAFGRRPVTSWSGSTRRASRSG